MLFRSIEVSPLLRESIALLAAKRAMLAASNNITTLVVGSSHGDFGFNPAYCPRSFNLCCRSQDLKHSFHLYRKRSEEHTSELQSLMRISYAVICLTKKNKTHIRK